MSGGIGSKINYCSQSREFLGQNRELRSMVANELIDDYKINICAAEIN